MFPVAYLPGQSTFEMSCTSGKFEAELFSMANATNFVENTEYEMPATETLTPDKDRKITLANEPVEGSVSINGMEQADVAAAGKFVVAGTEITFFEGDIADTVTVSYMHKITVNEANIDNKSTAMGEAVAVWPVYGSGDDCTDSSVIGQVIVKVYKCRVTAQPGFDSSLVFGEPAQRCA